MKMYFRTASLLYIFFLFLFGNHTYANHPFSSLICEGSAGPDTLICGYAYTLPSVGDWELLCPENGALVSLEYLNPSQNPVFKVSECGTYEIVFHEDGGMCKDTAIISFENPDRRTIGSDFNLELELDIDCLIPPSSCDNVLTIEGATPPELNWEFCASQFCNKFLYSTSPTTAIDDCLYDQIDILEEVVNSDGFACSDALLTGDNFLSTLNELLQNSTVDCALGPRCFPTPPPSNIIADTTYLNIPVLAGGQWHYFTVDNSLAPLSDSTFITIEGQEYLLVIVPGSDYYGPDEIVFSIFEVDSNGTYIPPSTNVSVQVEYLLEYSYELVEFITYYTEDDLEGSCPNTIIDAGSIIVPPAPPNPCGPISLNFGSDSNIDIEYGFLTCFELSTVVETCPGELTTFDSPGEFFFSCTDDNGCPFEKHVIIIEDAIFPEVEIVSYECDPGGETYTAEIQVYGSYYVNMEIQGLGNFNVNGSITISDIPNCVVLYGYVTDVNNGCYNTFDLYHCCECTNTQSSIDAISCEGEPFEILGQSFTQSGNYEILTTNSAGCDSLINLSLEILPVTNTYIEERICAGTDFVFFNQVLSEAGEYTHFEVNDDGCQEQYTLLLDVYATDDIQLTEYICEGNAYDFFDQQLDQSGTYAYNQVDANGCSYQVILQLEVSPIPEYFESVTLCKGSSIEIGGESISTAGTFSVVDYDNGPCGEIYTYDVSMLESSFTSESITICKGESVPLSGSTIYDEGIYIDTLTNANGCDSIIQIDVSIVSIEFEVATISSCPGEENGSMQIMSMQDGVAPFTYSIDGLNFTDEDEFENLSAGSYTVQVIDQTLCSQTKQVTIEESPELTAEIQDTYVLTCDEPSLNLSLDVDESTEVIWSTGNYGNEILIDEIGAYAVTLSNGCQNRSIEFTVEASEFDNSNLIYIPNVFSPNLDQINDEFKVYYDNTPINFQLEIYDRWGNKVFFTDNPELGWTGIYRNTDVDPGVYMYKLEAVVNSCFGNPKSIFKKGDVTLMK